MRRTSLVMMLLLTLTLASSHLPGDDSPSTAVLREIVLPKCQIKVVDRTMVAAERDGVIDDLPVRVGDKVTRGTLLVELRHEIATAVTTLAEARAGNDVNVRFADEVLKTAKEEYETALSLQSQGAITEQNVRQRRMEYERSRLSLEQAQFEQTIRNLESKQAEAELRAYRVLAPFSGTIRQVMKTPGESLRDGESVLELVGTDRVHVEGYGTLDELWGLAPGSEVMVQLDVPELASTGALEEKFTGKLIHVDDVVQPVSGKVRVVAEVQNRNNILRDGLRATMTITVKKPQATGPAESREAPSSQDDPSCVRP
ncbi:MAG: efflux RND transporter periplasmic adaptor subunit [Planctomycetaceae bacterium]